MAAQIRNVDQTGLKTGQALTIILLILGYVLDSWLLVAFVAAAQLLGALDLPFAPYRLFYRFVARPSGLARPHLIEDNPEPHRFAMLVGALFNGAAVLLLILSPAGTLTVTLAWALVGIVIALANLNFWLNFCLGCWMYYQLHRLGVPGFTHAPIGQE